MKLLAVLSIWGAITGFYGTKHWTALQVCQARDHGDRFALVQLRLRGARHVAALHLYSAKRGWVVMWADGRINRKIAPYTGALVRTEVTRLKARCLAP